MRLTKRHIAKLLVAVLLLAFFYSSDGFVRPQLDVYDRPTKRRLESMWNCSVALYVLGTYSTLWGNRFLDGRLGSVSLRSSYIVMGILAIVAGYVMMRSLQWLRKAESSLKSNHAVVRTARNSSPWANGPADWSVLIHV